MDRLEALVICWLGLFATFTVIVIAGLIYSYKVRKLASPTRITTTTEARVPAHMWQSSITRTTTTTPVKSKDDTAA